MDDGAGPVSDIADVMFVLRRRTAAAHTRLESALRLTDHDLSVSRYRDVLMRMHGFYDLLEPRLDAMFGGSGSPLPDWPSRRKTPMLRHDLAVLGVAEAALAALPRPRVPAVSDVAAAMGVLYVLEGATLGGRFIVEHVASTEVPAAATAFFGSYGEEVGRRWSQVRHALRAWSGADDARVAACAATAEALFGALEAEFSR
ncbi:biliverdin-producing heme oxygenase [Frankia sp. R82]|uniref:biliverdin-producing heme oxygenase n=1 Tax=Frankia sp. R82 TaxID=2950553 RepID=UPI002043133A|nr:biliverdin-producing heme oxygenase [Frankia sp. R82]MCM3882557.1 biliverdin-producing heme oxygenase [Frankia sp. R82]